MNRGEWRQVVITMCRRTPFPPAAVGGSYSQTKAFILLVGANIAMCNRRAWSFLQILVPWVQYGFLSVMNDQMMTYPRSKKGAPSDSPWPPARTLSVRSPWECSSPCCPGGCASRTFPPVPPARTPDQIRIAKRGNNYIETSFVDPDSLNLDTNPAFQVNPDPVPRFWWPKIGEKYSWNFFFFLVKIWNSLIHRPP
jgi:hypothetical protein